MGRFKPGAMRLPARAVEKAKPRILREVESRTSWIERSFDGQVARPQPGEATGRARPPERRPEGQARGGEGAMGEGGEVKPILIGPLCDRCFRRILFLYSPGPDAKTLVCQECLTPAEIAAFGPKQKPKKKKVE
jgi:hypothetical protein